MLRRLFFVLNAIAIIVLLVFQYTSNYGRLYNISNYAIAIALGFCSVSFSWARAEDDVDARKLILQAGRYFFRATVILIIASIFDYGHYSLQKYYPYHSFLNMLWYLYLIILGGGLLLFAIALDVAAASGVAGVLFSALTSFM